MHVNNFLVGCDPEFVGLNPSGNILQNPVADVNGTGPIGYDHSGWVLELRPEPAFYARTLVRRMARLLQDPRLLGLPKSKAGAFFSGRGPQQEAKQYGLGGHVHLDLMPYSPLTDPAPAGSVITDGHYLTEEQLQAYRPLHPGISDIRLVTFYAPQLEQHRSMRASRFSPDHRDRIGALDSLTMQLEHLDLLPSGESETRRGLTQYGKFGDVRVFAQPENQVRPFRTEYRTMGSWLLSPATAMLCLTGAKLAALDPKGIPWTRHTDWKGLGAWFLKYRQDSDVAFIERYILPKPLDKLKIDPNEDFREKWETVGR